MDNDAILKLAACNLFWEALLAIGLSPSDLRVLPTAKNFFRNSGRLKRKYPQAIIEQAINIVSTSNIIETYLDEELSRLQVEGIDVGEQVLIAATKNAESFYLTTGDKRCLKALANASELGDIKQRLKGRVICLEQLVLKLIETQDFELILNNILPAREYDLALKSIFGSGEKATKENVLLALEGYIANLRQETDELLAIL